MAKWMLAVIFALCGSVVFAQAPAAGAAGDNKAAAGDTKKDEKAEKKAEKKAKKAKKAKKGKKAEEKKSDAAPAAPVQK